MTMLPDGPRPARRPGPQPPRASRVDEASPDPAGPGSRRARAAKGPLIVCPLCRERFGSAVALDFHVKEDHGGSPGARAAVLAAYRVRDRARAEAREARAQERLDHLYKMGCPCGRPYAWHRREREALGWTLTHSAPDQRRPGASPGREFRPSGLEESER